MSPSARSQRMFNLTINSLTMPEVLKHCTKAVQDRTPIVLGVVNAAKVVNLQGDRRLARAMAECDLVLADGQAVVWASRLLRRPLPERVAGIDLFAELLRQADEHRWRVYLLGATTEVLADLLDRIEIDYPNVLVVGARDGYFREDESEEVAAHIAAAQPDLLFVGMTSPRKELFLQEFGHQLVGGVAHGVGGSFDVMSGHVRRAPEVMQRCGLEWLYRVYQEPRRLWRRYLFSNVAFMRLVLREFTTPTPPAWISTMPDRQFGQIALEATPFPAQHELKGDRRHAERRRPLST